jgi:hypothetical protein
MDSGIVMDGGILVVKGVATESNAGPGGGSYKLAYIKDGDDARELRELPCPLALNEGADGRNDREPVSGPLPAIRGVSFLSRELGPEGTDHSLSVVGELVASSKSSALLPPPALVDAEADPDVRLADDDLPLSSFPFSFSFSSKSMNIRERASL